MSEHGKMSRRRERQDAGRNIHCVNHSTDAALVMQAITQAQFPQTSSPLDFRHPSGYQSLNAEPSYPTILSKAAGRLGGGKKERKTTHSQKSLKQNSPRRGVKKIWKGSLFFQPYPWLFLNKGRGEGWHAVQSQHRPVNPGKDHVAT